MSDIQHLDEYAALIAAQLEYHTAYLAPPSTFQFALPDGRYLSVNDAVVGSRRALYFFGYDRIPPNLSRRVTAVLSRARRAGIEGGWSFGASERERRKVLRTLRFAIEIAYGSRYTGDTDRVPTAIQIDPRAPLVRIADRPPGQTIQLGEHA